MADSLYTASRVKQQVALVTHCDIQPEIVVLCKKVNDLLPEVVNIYNDVVKPMRFEIFNNPLQHRSSVHRYHCFRHIVGERTKTRA